MIAVAMMLGRVVPSQQIFGGGDAQDNARPRPLPPLTTVPGGLPRALSRGGSAAEGQTRLVWARGMCRTSMGQPRWGERQFHKRDSRAMREHPDARWRARKLQ